jgi:hypothetical protein
MTSNQHRNYALLYLERLRALIEHANLPDAEVKRLATEVNELLERHIVPKGPLLERHLAPKVRPQEAA